MERTDAELELIELVRDPIRRSLQSGVRGFGKQLFRLLGSTDAMRDALERVAGMDPQRYTYRAVIMDHAWNGIDSDTDRWWA